MSIKKFSWKSKIVFILFLVCTFCAKAGDVKQGEDSDLSEKAGSGCGICCDPRVDTILNLHRQSVKKIESIDSKIDVLDEKVDTLDSKIDVIDDDVEELLLDLDTVNSKLDVLDEKTDTIDSKVDDFTAKVNTIDSLVDEIKIDTDLNVTINSQVDVLDEKSDTIDSKLDVANIELVSIESKLDTWIGPLVETGDSKLDVIDSKLDEIQVDAAPVNSKIDILDEKLDTVSSKIDNIAVKVITIDSLVDMIKTEVEYSVTISSKVDILDEKIDTVDSKMDVANIELISIESKLDTWIGPLVETIDSKVDGVDSKVDQWVGQLLETIDSKVDLLDLGIQQLTSGQTITNPGVYVLIEQIECPITVAADNVRIDLSGFDICGTCTAITINANVSNVVIKNGSLIGSSDCSLSCDQGALANASGIEVNAGAQLVTIEDMTIFGYETGISFVGTSTQQIRSCHVKNCIVECCNAGYNLNHVIKTEFDNCRALNCYNSGFYQANSQYNIYRNSDAIRTENSDTINRALGFASVDGLGNLYDGCLAEGIKTTTGQLSLGPVGFLFEGDERESKILNSIANSTSVDASTAIAYGIKLSGVYDDLALTDSYDHGANIFAVKWSRPSPSSGQGVNYLAIAGDTGTGGEEIRVLSFDGTSLSTLETATFGTGLVAFNALSWRPDDRFLAAGGETSPDGYDIRVFGFDGLLLDELENSRAAHGGTVNSVDFSLNGEHLAVGGESGTDGYEVRVYTFDSVYLNEVPGANYDHGATVNSVAWAPHGDYLAVGGFGGTGGYELRVLGFNYTSLYDISSAVYAFDETTDFVKQIAWSPNQNYLAIAVGTTTLPGTSRLRVLILEFDSNTLTPVAEYESTSEANSVSWSPNSEYITVGLDTDEVLVLSFNGYTLAQESSYDHGAIVQSVDWSQHGKNIAIGGRNGTGGFDVRTFNVMTYPTKNLIDNNKVCNTSSQVGVQNAVGISGASGANSIIRNVAYDNDLNYSAGVVNLYDNTNDCCNAITDNLPLPTKSTHKSCDVPQVDTAAISTLDTKVDVVIPKVDAARSKSITVESKLDYSIGPLHETIESKVDLAYMESVSIESKFDQWVGPLTETIDSKVDVLLQGAEVIASCPWTIDTPGLYTLSENKTCCITIDADHVTLDLNDYTVSCDDPNAVIEILSGHANIEIKNGSIKGASGLTNDGILAGSDNRFVHFENLDIFSCDNGLRFAGTSSNNIKDCTIVNCTMCECNIGADLEYTIKTKFQNCQALNCVNAGFYQENCTYNVYKQSDVLSTQNTSTSERSLGFASIDGTGNLFTECIAEGISTTTGTLANGAVGFLLEGDEAESKIINCVANSSQVLDDTGIAYGIKLSGELTSNSVSNYEHGGYVLSVDWSPDANYLALGGQEGVDGVEFRVLDWDGVSLSDITTATLDFGALDVRSVSWSPDGQYLAVGIENTGVQVFNFTGLSLYQIASYNISTPLSVKWSPDGNYLAIGLFAGQARVLSFVNETLSLIPGTVYNHGAIVYGVDWSPDGRYLAIGGDVAAGGETFRVLNFDGKILSAIDTADFAAGERTRFTWSPNQEYIAIGFGTVLQVFRFDGTYLQSIEDAIGDLSGAASSISWSPNGEYVVANSSMAESLFAFSFNGYSLIQVFNYFQGDFIGSVNWSKNGKYIALGGRSVDPSADVRVLYDVMDYPSKCLIDSNKVCNATGVNAGIGIAGSGGTNTIIRNIASDNDTNLGTGIYNFTTGLGGTPNRFDNLANPIR